VVAFGGGRGGEKGTGSLLWNAQKGGEILREGGKKTDRFPRSRIDEGAEKEREKKGRGGGGGGPLFVLSPLKEGRKRLQPVISEKGGRKKKKEV